MDKKRTGYILRTQRIGYILWIKKNWIYPTDKRTGYILWIKRTGYILLIKELDKDTTGYISYR